MDFNKLRTFVTVVENGGITAAAVRLFRTQQAISLQIKLLEEELGVALFQRVGPKLSLTAEGSLLYKQSKNHLIELEKVWEKMRAGPCQAGDAIILGAWLAESTNYLPYLVTSFRNLCPKVSIDIMLGQDVELEELLATDKIDFAFVLRLNHPKLFCSQTVFSRELVPVASARYLSRAGSIHSIEDTLQHHLLDGSTGYSAYELWIEQNAPDLLPLARKKQPTIKVGNDFVQKQLVLNHNGIAFLPKEFVEKDLAAGDIIHVLRTECDPVVIKVNVAYRKGRSLSGSHAQFLEFTIHSHQERTAKNKPSPAAASQPRRRGVRKPDEVGPSEQAIPTKIPSSTVALNEQRT